MTARAAGDVEPSAPPRRRRLARGMAAAGALSLAVHAAVLLGRVPAGSAASTAAPPAPVLLTRLVAAPAPAVPSPEEPALVAAPPPVQVAPAPAAEPPKVMPTIDREAATSSLPVPPPLPVQAPPPMVAKPLAAPSVPPPIAIADTSPIAAPPAPAVTYQGSMGLDPPPRPLADIDPVIPEAAGSRGGVVVLRLYINEHGTVDKAEMVRSTPPGLFDASMLEAATQVRFAPGYLAGVAVKSQVTMEIKIRGLGSGAEAGGRTY